MIRTKINYGNTNVGSKEFIGVGFEEIFNQMINDFKNGTTINITTNDNPRKIDAINFQIHFVENLDDISLHKPWGIVVLNSKLKTLAEKNMDKVEDNIKILYKMSLDHILDKATI